MGEFDILKFAPIVAIALGTIAIFIALRVAFVRRDLWGQKLKLALGLRAITNISDQLPASLKTAPVSAVFAILPRGGLLASHLPLTVSIENPSPKSITNVVLQISYPERFVFGNSEIMKSFEEANAALRAANTMPKEDEINSDVFGEAVKTREVRIVRGVATIRYNIGLIRPGEHVALSEPLRIVKPTDELQYTGISGSTYARIANIVSNINGVIDHCVVQATVYADNLKAIERNVSICATHVSAAKSIENIASDFVQAHWFGRPPRSGIYFVPVFPLSFLFGPRRKRGPALAEILTLFPRKVGTANARPPSSDPKSVSVVTVLDPLDSAVQYITLNLPIYDFFDLPDGIKSAEEALAYVGAGRIFPSWSNLKRRVQQLAARKSRVQAGDSPDR